MLFQSHDMVSLISFCFINDKRTKTIFWKNKKNGHTVLFSLFKSPDVHGKTGKLKIELHSEEREI